MIIGNSIGITVITLFQTITNAAQIVESIGKISLICAGLRFESDNEKIFCISRGKNPQANAMGSNGQIAGIGSTALFNMGASAKGNCTKTGDDTLYFSNELVATKVPLRKL